MHFSNLQSRIYANNGVLTRFSLTDLLGINRDHVRYLMKYVWLVALTPVYVPLYAVMNIGVKCKIIKTKLSKYLFQENTPAKLNKVCRKYPISDVAQVSTEEHLDFVTHRAPVYVSRLTLWSQLEVAKQLSGLQTAPLVSNEQLIYSILNTVYGHSTTWNEERKMFHFKMIGFDELVLYHGFYWDAREAYISEDLKKIVIVMFDGKEYSSDCNTFEERANFDQAKLHLQVCMTHYAPGLAHNHIHFVFPSTVSVIANQVLNREGVLYNLLAPHLRFTTAINFQALQVGQATDNNNTLLDKTVVTWQPFPINREQFVFGVARKCEKHYHHLGDQDYSAVEQKTNEDGNKDSDSTEDQRNHMIFPPQFTSDPSINKIPYMDYLNGYYKVVKKFVSSIAPLIDREEYEHFSKKIAEHVPRFDRVDMINGITTFIHQQGVIHFSDHNSFLRYFGWKHGSISLRFPFVDFNDKEHWNSVLKDIPCVTDVKKIMSNLHWLLDTGDIMRTRSFFNAFVDFIPNPACNLQLVDTKYNFSNELAKAAAKQFISDLKQHDQLIKVQKPDVDLSNPSKDVRASGKQLVPLEDLVRTICY